MARVVRRGLRGVRCELANSARSVCALVVPFLLRIAADSRHRHRAAPRRADSLVLAGETARRNPGPGLRSVHARGAAERCHADDMWVHEPSGYPGHGSLQAARAAIAADAHLVTALLEDPDPHVRSAAA
ncbi:hypothetical protein [Embleya sp. NPDC050493]|uniref:hypothetical protein n=1 Tax=Embleya sp. NPDC050493 TaxID=3363989 RepID=UPI0037A7E56C